MTTSKPNSSVPVPNANHNETIARTLLERAPILVYVVDLNFRVVLMNRELREVSGWDTSSCGSVEQLLANFYPDDDYRAPIQAIHDAWGNTPSEQVRDTVMVLTAQSGLQRSVSWTTARLRVGTGPVRGYIAIGIDITIRRNLEKWFTLFQRSLQQMNEALALVDPQSNILAWSAGATALLGHEEADAQGTPLRALLGADGSDTDSESLAAALATEGSGPFNASLRTAAGKAETLLLDVSRLEGSGGELLAHLVQMSAPAADNSADAVELEDATRRATEAETEAEAAKSSLATAEGSLEEAKAEAEAAKSSLAAAEGSLEEAKLETEAAKSSLAAAEGSLEEAKLETEVAKFSLAAAEGSLEEAKAEADENSAALAAGETRIDLAEDIAEALRAELEQNSSDWNVERAELVRSHVANRDALVEAGAKERTDFIKRMDADRAELEEQLRNDILAAEERSEGQLEAQEQVHERARKEWDDAMAIAAHEMAGRMSAITDKISQILIEGAEPSGQLPGSAISQIIQLIGGPAMLSPQDDEAPSTHFDLSADDLVLDDEGEEAIDAPPPVSPAMVATASELEAHVPSHQSQGEPEIDLDPEPEIDLDLEPEIDLDLEPESDLDLEPESDLDLEPESDLDLEPESDLDLEPESDLDLEPESDLDVARIPGLDEVGGGGDDHDLVLEPTEEDLTSDSDSKSKPN